MKSLFYWRILITICGVLALSCQKETINNAVSPTAQGSEKNGVAAQTAQKAGVFRDNFHLPVEFTAFSQCAGEELHFVGYFHWNSVTVIDATGGFHSVFVSNDHSLSGVGLITGIKYHEVGAYTEVFNITGSGAQEGTFTITLNYIGQGPGNNAINKANFHYTVNANGTTTVIFENFTQILCQ
jgi:hypothetical protein